MVAEFGQQQWSCTNFRCSDRTLKSRDRIFDFSQEMGKICAGAENWTPAEIFIGRSGTTSPYSIGETLPIKAEWPEPSDHLRSTCLRINTSTRIWTRALQPDLEEVSSWRFCRAQIVRGRQTFPLKFWICAEILEAQKFYQTRRFQRPPEFYRILPGAWILYVRLNFLQEFSAANFRSNFPPKFSAANFRSNFLPEFSAGILGICHNFH